MMLFTSTKPLRMQLKIECPQCFKCYQQMQPTHATVGRTDTHGMLSKFPPSVALLQTAGDAQVARSKTLPVAYPTGLAH
jgi:hypothetical protein